MNVAYGADTECRLSTDVLHRESACSGVTSRAFLGRPFGNRGKATWFQLRFIC